MHVSTLTLLLPDLTPYTTLARPMAVEVRSSHGVLSRKPHGNLQHAVTTTTGAYQPATNITGDLQAHEQPPFQHQETLQDQVSLPTYTHSSLHTLTRRPWFADGRLRNHVLYTASRQEHYFLPSWSITCTHSRNHCKTQTKTNYHQNQPKTRQYQLVWKSSTHCLWIAWSHTRRDDLLTARRQERCLPTHGWSAEATHFTKLCKTKTKTQPHHNHLVWQPQPLTRYYITTGPIRILYQHVVYRLERFFPTYGRSSEPIHPSTHRKTKTKTNAYQCQHQPRQILLKWNTLNRWPWTTAGRIQRAQHTERNPERYFSHYCWYSQSTYPSQHQKTNTNTNSHPSLPLQRQNQLDWTLESQPRQADNRVRITNADGPQKNARLSKRDHSSNAKPLYTQQINQETLKEPLTKGGRHHLNPNHNLIPPPHEIYNWIYRTHTAKILNGIRTSQLSPSKHQIPQSHYPSPTFLTSYTLAYPP